MKRWIILFWIVTAPAWAQSNHVIVISLDGCRPEFYLPGALTKTLTSLCERGSYALGALCWVFLDSRHTLEQGAVRG